MSTAILEKLVAERDEITEYVQKTLEGIEGRDLSDVEVRSVNEAKARLEAIKAQAEPLQAFLATKESASAITALATRSTKPSNAETRSAGELFVASEQFRSYRGHGRMESVEVESRALPHLLASFDDVLPRPVRIDLTPPETPYPILGLVNNIQVSTNAVEAVVWSKVAGGAAVVPEGQSKPTVEWGATVTPVTLDTIAATTSFSRQLAQDSTAVRSFIDTELRREVTIKQAQEATAALVAATLPTATGETLLKAIRTGIATVQIAGYQPSAVLLHPSDMVDLDFEVMDATVDGTLRRATYWGLTAVADPNQPEGTATLGDFSSGVHRYIRSGVELFLTDSHQDAFVKNLIWALAEARGKTVVVRPAALVECAATVTP